VHGERDASLGHAAAFLLDLLALVALQAPQQVAKVEHRLHIVLLPVELHAFAQHPARAVEGRTFGVVDEEHVRR
jgi:hypothetical protein